MLDLESMPGRVLPVQAMADVWVGACLERPEPRGTLRVLCLGHDEACDQPRLIVGKLPHAALRRFEKPDYEKIVEVAMEGMDEELGPALLIENVRGVHEREARPEASGPDEKIDFLFASVGKDNAFAVESLDPGLRHDAPMHDVVEIDGAGGRMRLEQLVVRRGQVVAPMRPDDDPQAPPIEFAHHSARHRPAAGEVDKRVGRLAEYDLGKEVVAATHRMHRAHSV